jgi:hypothetical protein
MHAQVCGLYLSSNSLGGPDEALGMFSVRICTCGQNNALLTGIYLEGGEHRDFPSLEVNPLNFPLPRISKEGTGTHCM